jgi:hypothetical protein
MFWLLGAHNSAVDVTNTKRSQTAYSIEQHLNFEIHLFPLHCYMESAETKVKGLSEIRFRWIIFLIRLSGIPFKMKKMSIVYATYMISVIICSCSTFLGMIADVYVHRDDLRHVSTTMRLLIGMTNMVWIFFYCRYVTKTAISNEASHVLVC